MIFSIFDAIYKQEGTSYSGYYSNKRNKRLDRDPNPQQTNEKQTAMNLLST